MIQVASCEQALIKANGYFLIHLTVKTKINDLPSKRKTGENRTNFIRACGKVYFVCTFV